MTVAIGAVQDSNIIEYAQKAENDYTIAQEKEQIGLALSEWNIEKVIPGNNPVFKTVIENALQGKIQPIQGNNDGPLTVTFIKTGNVYTVTKGGEINELEPGISIMPTAITIAIGETAQITPKLTGIEGTITDITYTSSNTNVATVSTEGLVTGQTEGETTITVNCGEYKATCKVTVTATQSVVQAVKAFNLNISGDEFIGILSPDSTELAFCAPSILVPSAIAREMDIPTIESIFGVTYGENFFITENVKFKKLLVYENVGVFALSENEEKLYWHGAGGNIIDGSIYFEVNNSIDASQYYNESTEVEYYYCEDDSSYGRFYIVDYSNKNIKSYICQASARKEFEISYKEISRNDAPVTVTVAGETITITENAQKIKYNLEGLSSDFYAYIENNRLYISYGEGNHGIEAGKVLSFSPELIKFVNETFILP